MATTLADLKKAAEGDVVTSIDDAVPAGHFSATAKVLGHTTTYLFEGEKDDLNAVVKGHIVILYERTNPQALGYRKGGITGGYYLGRVENYEDAFAQMV